MKHVEANRKFCPKCGGSEIFWASGLPQLWSIWQCRECGYRGPLVIEDGELAAKIRQDFMEKKNRKAKDASEG